VFVHIFDSSSLFSMDEEDVEVVEEEAVIDDSNLLRYDDNFFGEVYEEFVADDGNVEEEEAGVGPLSLEDTVLIKIKPELQDANKKTFRVPAANISDELYVAFCDKVTNFDHAVERKLEPALDCLYHSGDWAMARNVPDTYLGVLDQVMVHLPTSKLLVKTSDRSRLFTECVAKHQNTRNPVASCLQDIQKLYTGLPPVGQLRDILMEELRKVFPLAPTAGSIAQPTNRKLLKRGAAWKRGGEGGGGRGGTVGRKKTVKTVVGKEEREGGEGREGEETVGAEKNVAPPVIEPIDDELYDELAEVIASGNKQVELLQLPQPFQALLAKGSLIADLVNHRTADLEEVIRAGWCIRERTTGRVVPRKGDVQRIWRRIHDRMMRSNSLTQIVAYVDAKFVGVTTLDQRRLARVEDVYKGSRVVFPPRPTVIGRRPMQYVQIDIIDPPYDEYQSEEAESALLIVDLHSQFAFCKPLIDPSTASHDLLRFTYESFLSFGPPEAYATASEKHAFALQSMMEDIERQFNVSIKCIGVAREHPCGKAISSESVRKVSGETSDFRWIDGLHTATLEWNQRPNKTFNHTFSPFEVMFGRRAWGGESRVPPWISREE
ncbi:hypothetical protein PFISCL1PPCAC_12372, partial [Pristionchus fissidentatus]